MLNDEVMSKVVSLLTYVDRLAGDLPGLTRVMSDELAVFAGVHMLPFFLPIDGVDAGFDPVEHSVVDPRLGDWDDVARLAGSTSTGTGRQLTADLIVNHMSAQSRQFQDWLARGDQSDYAGLFLTFDDVFPYGARADEITAFYRPRPGLPFTAYRLASGRRVLVWTTFEPTQVDINVTSPKAWSYLDGVLDVMADHGIATARLDAIGYAVKTPGTDSFMTPETLRYVDELTRHCHDRGLSVLVEVHSHFRDQLAIARRVDWIYDFALPPLLLLAIYTGSLAELGRWLTMRPDNCVAVLDTHDGIGVVDACGNDRDPAGLISDDQADVIFAEADRRTGGVSGQASITPEFSPRPHQINSTFLDVLGGDEEAFLACRVAQLFLPGQAHIYYVGLLGGHNDIERWRRTGVGREINRHAYTDAERRAAEDSDLTRAVLALVRLVSSHPAMDAQQGARFSWGIEGDTLSLTWTRNADRCAARVRFAEGTARFEVTDGRRTASAVADLASW